VDTFVSTKLPEQVSWINFVARWLHCEKSQPSVDVKAKYALLFPPSHNRLTMP
jgi:hypothetical protein